MQAKNNFFLRGLRFRSRREPLRWVYPPPYPVPARGWSWSRPVLVLVPLDRPARGPPWPCRQRVGAGSVWVRRGRPGRCCPRGRCGSPKNVGMLLRWRRHSCHGPRQESVAVGVAVLWLPIGPAKLLIYKGVATVAIVAVRSQEHIYIRIIMYTVYNPKPLNAFLMALPQLPRRVKRHRHRKATD
jgi:hypothetical protein